MTGPYGSSPPGDSKYVWVQVDSSKNRDKVLQYFVNILTGQLVYGKTSGSFSDHIHLYSLAGVDSNYNLNPVNSDVSPNGNLIGTIAHVGATVAATAGGVLAGSAAIVIIVGAVVAYLLVK